MGDNELLQLEHGAMVTGFSKAAIGSIDNIVTMPVEKCPSLIKFRH